MRILLDENVHAKLRFRFPGHDVLTVTDMEWKGKRNGEQNVVKYPVPVLILDVKRSDYEFLVPLVGKIKEILLSELPEGVTLVSPD